MNQTQSQSQKDRKKEQLQILKKRLGTVPESLKEQVKTHKKVETAIKKALKGSEDDPSKELTIPEIAKVTGFSTKTINWHLASMRKYSKAQETPNKKGSTWNLYYKWALITNK